MRNILLPMTLLVSCGDYSEPLATCNESDFVTGGVCVITNGYNINPSMIEFAVDAVSISIEKKLDTYYDLPVLFGDLSVSVEYVDPDSPKLVVDGEDARGVQRGPNTAVNYVGKEGTHKCIEHYYVFGHELLHVISEYVLEATGKANNTHNVPNVFLEWADLEGVGDNLTAEYSLYLRVGYRCIDVYGELK
jgi:hypothetical protein